MITSERSTNNRHKRRQRKTKAAVEFGYNAEKVQSNLRSSGTSRKVENSLSPLRNIQENKDLISRAAEAWNQTTFKAPATY